MITTMPKMSHGTRSEVTTRMLPIPDAEISGGVLFISKNYQVPVTF
jgi:hypothetical protein